MRQQITRRLKQAGLPAIITPHSFRVMVVSDLLSASNAAFTDAEQITAHPGS